MSLTASRRLAGLAALTSSVWLAPTLHAGTLDVPAQYPTIQGAIVAAQPGDTVLVAPGTYFETIDFLGKGITVQSNGGAAVTTIDGGGAGSVVTFQTHETPASVLSDLTITGGAGTVHGPFALLVGGGVYVNGSSPVLLDCVITGNTVANFGGGVFISDTGLGTPVLIEHCVLSDNATTSAVKGGGGGLTVEHGAAVVVHSCSLLGNSTATNGGGFLVHRNSKARIASSLIAANTAPAGPGGGGRFSTGKGSAFSSFEMTECYVFDNSSLSGGGLSMVIDESFQAPSAQVRRSRFEGNHASLVGGGLAGGTDASDGVWVHGSVFIANTAGGSGGGVEARKPIHLVSCTLVGNSAPVGGGMHANAVSELSHCIVWGNSVGQLSGATGVPEWCDVEGGAPGPGNIDVDPFFVDEASGDLHLAPTSACVDAGNPAWFPVGKDLDGDPRVLFGHIDIGADEASFPKGPWTFLGHAAAGAGGEPSLVGDGTLVGGTPMTLALSGAAANAPGWLVVGGSQILLPFKGGVMVPAPDQVLGPLGTGPSGGFAFGTTWPLGLPSGFVVTLQSWVADAGGPAGFSASNGLAAEGP
ncbi:MAG TPA: hypothetical protein VMV01_03180 [Planctomycetota bacterium]|nr:hypothetical protein [Planctomycetota bacterium]